MSEGYVVGEPHPRSLRQWHELPEAEVADLADMLVFTLAKELARRGVAGAQNCDQWALADSIRQTVAEHHRDVFRRYLAQALERLSG